MYYEQYYTIVFEVHFIVMYSHISRPLSVMRILQPAGSTAAEMEDPRDRRTKKETSQEVILDTHVHTPGKGTKKYEYQDQPPRPLAFYFYCPYVHRLSTAEVSNMRTVGQNWPC